jgi:hypothetical protein
VNNEPDAANKREDKSRCACPFCDAPVKKVFPFCKDCGKELNYCSECGKPLPPTQKVCPDCNVQ